MSTLHGTGRRRFGLVKRDGRIGGSVILPVKLRFLGATYPTLPNGDARWLNIGSDLTLMPLVDATLIALLGWTSTVYFCRQRVKKGSAKVKHMNTLTAWPNQAACYCQHPQIASSNHPTREERRSEAFL